MQFRAHARIAGYRQVVSGSRSTRRGRAQQDELSQIVLPPLVQVRLDGALHDRWLWCRGRLPAPGGNRAAVGAARVQRTQPCVERLFARDVGDALAHVRLDLEHPRALGA